MRRKKNIKIQIILYLILSWKLHFKVKKNKKIQIWLNFNNILYRIEFKIEYYLKFKKNTNKRYKID